MTATYEFYSGTATDPRTYYGADWARWFRSQFTSGVVYNYLNDLAVSQHDSGDMSLNVATGSVWAYGYNALIDATEVVDISANTSGNPRIDRVVARNTIASGISIYVITGTPAVSPVAPDLVTDGVTYYDVPLAWVEVANGATQILTADIHDERIYSTLKNVDFASILFDGNLDAGGNTITELGDGIGVQDLLNKGQCDASDNFADVPQGSVVVFGTTTVPAGFLLCDGASYLRADYPALFSAIGVLHGSADSTHFNVPNMTGRIPVGHDPLDADFATVGLTGGATTVTVTEANLPAHVHTGIKTATYTIYSESGHTQITADPVNGTTGSTGGGGAHTNMGPAIAMAYGIKV
jgi:microcystin-dependent protein